MSDDFDFRQPIDGLRLSSPNPWKTSNGTIIQGDRDAYRVVMKTGEARIFMSVAPYDMGFALLDVTEEAGAGYFEIHETGRRAIPALF